MPQPHSAPSLPRFGGIAPNIFPQNRALNIAIDSDRHDRLQYLRCPPLLLNGITLNSLYKMLSYRLTSLHVVERLSPSSFVSLCNYMYIVL